MSQEIAKMRLVNAADPDDSSEEEGDPRRKEAAAAAAQLGESDVGWNPPVGKNLSC
jgi:hypothetical protein